MRKIIIGAMLLLFAMASFSQQENPPKPVSRETYLKRSKHQKTAAVILLSAGILSTALGSIQTNPNSIEGGDNSQSPVLLVAGLAAIGASIPLLVASQKNRKKAANASAYLKLERAPLLQPGGPILHSYAALSIKLSL